MALSWIVTHWPDLIQSTGIIAGLLFTAHSIRKDTDARKVANLIAISERHHAIWKEVYQHPELLRVTDPRASLGEMPVTEAEHRFVISVIIHLDSVHRALQAKMFVKLEGLEKDVRGFFSLPIPRAVWERLKPLQDADFVRFVDAALE